MFKIYVINLERSTERKKNVLKQFKKWGISNFEFVKGLDASKYSREELESYLDKENLVKPLPDGMIGCCMGHVFALRKFYADSTTEIGIIMEDDFIIKADINIILNSVDIGFLNNGPLLLYGYVKQKVSFQKIKEVNNNHSIYKLKSPFEIYSAVGYMVNKKMAMNLINIMTPIRDCSDSWYYFKQNKAFENLQIIYPFLMEHEIFESDRAAKGFLSKLIDRIITYKTPVLYNLLKFKRQKYVASNHSLISFLDS